MLGLLFAVLLSGPDAWPDAWPDAPPAEAKAEKPKPATKPLRVIDVPAMPARMVRECVYGVCREREIPGVPATWKEIQVQADLTPEGEVEATAESRRLTGGRMRSFRVFRK